MEKDTQKKVNLFDERDSSHLGFQVEPPYFFGAYDQFQQVENDPFATEGWINHCQTLINEWSNPKFAGFQLDLSQYSLVEHIKKLLANNGEISILDIGGGFGDNFYYITQRN